MKRILIKSSAGAYTGIFASTWDAIDFALDMGWHGASARVLP